MEEQTESNELYHEIFGSILDRTEMTPYLLKKCDGYRSALAQATQMMGNRGFDVFGTDELSESEKKRAQSYILQVRQYYSGWLFPFLKKQLSLLSQCSSQNRTLYENGITAINECESVLCCRELTALINADPRHLFLIASSKKYPNLFSGYDNEPVTINISWQRMACSILKMAHLVKAIEEESQDIHDYAQLGLFFESRGKSLSDLFSFNWEKPDLIPDEESARRGFVKLAAFFIKMNQSMTFDQKKGCYCFNSGDGVEVDIVGVKARLKSPESMFTKLGKDVEGDVHDIRDILAITFLLKSREDTLTLFHALQKRGVILQENTVSHSITQTLFKNPADMEEAVRRLMINITRSEGQESLPTDDQLKKNAEQFFNALSANSGRNHHSSDGHRKFQCKINFSLAIHRSSETRQILVPGSQDYIQREENGVITRQHTIPVELRISDEQSWESSEQKGDAHHEAYKFRQLISLMNRLFMENYFFPPEAFKILRQDQNSIFAEHNS